MLKPVSVFSVYLSDPVLECITQWNRKTTTATLDATCDSTKHPYQARPEIWKVIQARSQKNFPSGALCARIEFYNRICGSDNSQQCAVNQIFDM